MNRHIFTIPHPAKDTPSATLPDGAFTGNGDSFSFDWGDRLPPTQEQGHRWVRL